MDSAGVHAPCTADSFRGTEGYQAPEICHGPNWSPAADVFSAGVITLTLTLTLTLILTLTLTLTLNLTLTLTLALALTLTLSIP